MTSQHVLKNLIFFSVPYLGAYFLQRLYGMADLFIIGQFEGTAQLTAVSLGGQVMNLLTVMIVGLSMGGTILIGKAVGANDLKNASKIVGTMVTTFLFGSLLGMALLILLIPMLLQALQTPLAAWDATVSYLWICFLGLPFITAYNVISSIFRGSGDSKSPLYFVCVACVCNIGLDYLFMGALQMATIKGRRSGFE